MASDVIISYFSDAKLMNQKLAYVLFFVLIVVMAYRWWFASRREGRLVIRQVTRLGFVLCMASLGFWFVSRLENILAISSGPQRASIFASPWLWISAMCVGVTLLLVSFFTRVRHDHAA